MNKEVKKFLRCMRKHGVKLIVNGVKCTYSDVDKISMVFEDGTYIPDYEMNEKGKVVTISWEKVCNS